MIRHTHNHLIGGGRGGNHQGSGPKGARKKKFMRVSCWGFYGCFKLGKVEVHLSAEPSNILVIYHLMPLNLCSNPKTPKSKNIEHVTGAIPKSP